MPRRVSTVGTYRGDATLDFGGRQVQVIIDLAVKRETRMVGSAEDARWEYVRTMWSGSCR